MIATDTIEQQARYLADYGREMEPGIVKVYWFPAADEIRLVSLFAMRCLLPRTGKLCPFYFRPSPKDGLTAWSAVAMIQPTEFGKLDLPKNWVAWEEAIEI